MAKLCTMEIFSLLSCCLQDGVSQKDEFSRDRGAERGFGSRGRRRAPRRFGGWRGSRWAGQDHRPVSSLTVDAS